MSEMWPAGLGQQDYVGGPLILGFAENLNAHGMMKEATGESHF